MSAAMPRANGTEAFVWRAAAGPERRRLLGAIAIAVSSGCLGAVVGRWSAPVAPATRTAALIEAVAKETSAKSAARAHQESPAPKKPAAATEAEPQATAPAAPAPPSAATPDFDNARQQAKAGPASAALPTPEEAPTPHDEAIARVHRPDDAPVTMRPRAPNYQALRDYVLGR